jgi:hypothetical protein
MIFVGFEPTVPAPEWAKKIHALDRAATVTVSFVLNGYINTSISS